MEQKKVDKVDQCDRPLDLTDQRLATDRVDCRLSLGGWLTKFQAATPLNSGRLPH